MLHSWHLLSLDAPTVAVVWALLLARVARASLVWSDLAVLGLGTWLVYVVDRLLDGRPSRERAGLRERHRFYARRRGVTIMFVATGSAGLAALIVTRLRPELRTAYACIFAVSLAYLTVVHAVARGEPGKLWWCSKEAAVGVLFAAACAAPAWTATTRDRRELGVAAILFAALCWLNCIAIELWEARRDEPGEATRRRGRLTRKAGMIALAAGLAACAPGLAASGAVIALSALLLLWLDFSSLPPRKLRVLADMALLTPLALLLR